MMKLTNLSEMIRGDLWRIRRKDLPPRKYFWLRQARIVVLSFREFNRDKCSLHASALTFYTILSVVPLLAMAFGIAKGFGLAALLERTLQERLKEQGKIVDQVIEFSNNLLANASGGVVAGIGVALLLWTIIKVLGNIEESFNEIWGVTKGRTLGRKVSDYLAFMLIAPLVFVIASSMSVLVTSKIEAIVRQLELWGWVGAIVYVSLKVIPLSLLVALFTFTYLFMPNTKVNLASGLTGGFVAGILYLVVQWIYIRFQIGVASYGAIYGSFAALPLFLVWMQMSWLIILFGAEVAFAHQNVDTYEFEPDCPRVSPTLKRLLSLAATHYCVKMFDQGKTPPTAEEIGQHLEAPVRLVNQILYELVEAHVLSEVKREQNRVVAYQPARNIEEMTVASVLSQLNDHGVQKIPYATSAELRRLAESLDAFRQCQTHSEANLRLKDI